MEYLYTYLWAIAPVVELRGATPIGYLHYELGIIPATLLGILGGITIVVFCIIMLPILFRLIEYWPFLNKYKEALLEKTRKQYSQKNAPLGRVFSGSVSKCPLTW